MRKEVAKDKKLTELMTLADELSRGYFKQGLNCAECVTKTLMDIYEVNLPDEVICMATGFGGGMGHTKNTCGAITGAVLALGMIKGRKNPFGPKDEMMDRINELQNEIYPVFGNMIEEIEDKYGTLICSEMSNPFGDFDSKPRKKNCMEIIGVCSQLAVKYAER